jgi:hypothetical protein
MSLTHHAFLHAPPQRGGNLWSLGGEGALHNTHQTAPLAEIHVR